MGMASFTNMAIDRARQAELQAEARTEAQAAEAQTLQSEEKLAEPKAESPKPPAKITPKVETTKKAG